MTYKTRHDILRSVFGLAAGILLTACHSDEPVADTPASAESSFDIKFAIAVGSEASTRTAEDEVEDETGTAAENVIDTKDLKILVFDEKQTLYDVIYDNGMVLPSHSESPSELLAGPYLMPDNYYYFSVRLNPKSYNKSTKFAIVALANWEGTVSDPRLSRHFGQLEIGVGGIGKLTIGQLENALFTLNPDRNPGSNDASAPLVSWTPGDGRWIPMFGSRYRTLEKYNSNIYNKTNPMSLGRIDLVRAFAKIEVINKDTFDNSPKIKSISLTSRNVDGRLMQNFVYTDSTSHVTDVSIHTGSRFSENEILFHEDGHKYTVYVPELNLTGRDNARKAIRITLDAGNGSIEEKWLWLAPYGKDGRPMTEGPFGEWEKLLRNHIYRYTINSLGFDFRIECERWKYGGKYHIDFENIESK